MTRLELYDLVWSVPMGEVAQRLGMSNKSVAARCAANAVPTPPRGYWTQVASNKAGVKPELGGDVNQPIIMLVNRAPVRPSSTDAPALPPMEEGRVSVDWCAEQQTVDHRLVRALADDLLAQEVVVALLSAVASRAAALTPHEARPILNWVSAVRAQLDLQDPADKLIRLLRAAQ